VIDDDSDVKVGAEGIIEEKKFINHFEITSTLIHKWSTRTLVLPSSSQAKWKLLCEFLGNVPPVAPYPALTGHGQRQLSITENNRSKNSRH